MKQECNICKNHYKSLTKEGLCAHCHKDKNNSWAPRFSNGGSKKSNGEE